MLSFIYAFVQQLSIERQLCVRHCYGVGNKVVNQIDRFLLHGA